MAQMKHLEGNIKRMVCSICSIGKNQAKIKKTRKNMDSAQMAEGHPRRVGTETLDSCGTASGQSQW